MVTAAGFDRGQNWMSPSLSRNRRQISRKFFDSEIRPQFTPFTSAKHGDGV
jgi:hypothetical protein